VATDPKRIELRIDADPRFAAAAGGAVRYLAEASGMPEEVCREFREATIRACLEAFEASDARSHIVELCRFADRLEVVLDPEAGSNAVRIARPVGSHR
jgi:hypothetical protein